jgi:hypothetical protein
MGNVLSKEHPFISLKGTNRRAVTTETHGDCGSDYYVMQSCHVNFQKLDHEQRSRVGNGMAEQNRKIFTGTAESVTLSTMRRIACVLR